MPTRGFILPGYGIPPQGPVGPVGPEGPEGPMGPAGPTGGNEVTSASETPFTGLLKGEDGHVAEAAGGVDYLRPEDVANKSDVGHTHTPAEAGAAPEVHNHDAAYAAAGHDHAGVYAAAGHNHDSAYATAGHNHAGVYSAAGHTHTAAQVGAAAAAVEFTVTVDAFNWTGTGPWTQTITVAGITAIMCRIPRAGR